MLETAIEVWRVLEVHRRHTYVMRDRNCQAEEDSAPDFAQSPFPRPVPAGEATCTAAKEMTTAKTIESATRPGEYTRAARSRMAAIPM